MESGVIQEVNVKTWDPELRYKKEKEERKEKDERKKEENGLLKGEFLVPTFFLQ